MPSVLMLTAFLLKEEGGWIVKNFNLQTGVGGGGGGSLIRAFTVMPKPALPLGSNVKCEDLQGSLSKI